MRYLKPISSQLPLANLTHIFWSIKLLDLVDSGGRAQPVPELVTVAQPDEEAVSVARDPPSWSTYYDGDEMQAHCFAEIRTLLWLDGLV